ncbi:hypothetical protein B0T13DRAFT_451789 [Neurospora crassa]|nr:hypothetical protein B0T13DRAFT_451789 [Neurospora crassa]
MRPVGVHGGAADHCGPVYDGTERQARKRAAYTGPAMLHDNRLSAANCSSSSVSLRHQPDRIEVNTRVPLYPQPAERRDPYAKPVRDVQDSKGHRMAGRAA